MRVELMAMLFSAAALSGCATGNGMNHGAMSPEEMIRHCEMMEQHPAQGGHDGAQHDPGRHGGMSHEEMAQHCAMMRERQNGGGQGSSASSERLQTVAEAGAEVMPFALERTTHTFLERPWGGEQRVVSDDGDAAQIGLIRSHLTQEAAKFARGDFSSPEAIHGRDMPGLGVLRERHEAIDVAYAETPAGASITYRSQDAEVVGAIHAWFAAQRTDHGAHASH
jgi:hypothetical protein